MILVTFTSESNRQKYNEILLLPCALFGIHWTMFYTHYSLNLAFQFWIHTEIIRTLGPFELIFNTPVEEGINISLVSY